MQSWWPFLPFVWLLGVLAASVVTRIRAARPIFPRVPEGALFAARFGSGHSRRNLLTRLGGAGHCLLVAVTRDRLVIVPFFPFNLLFLPDLYGLELDLAPAAIRDVRDGAGLFGRRILITYLAPDPRVFELRVGDADGFLAALREMRYARRGPGTGPADARDP